MPEGIDEIGRYGFGKCTKLKTVSIPNSLKKIEECAFINDSNLNNVDFTSENMEIGLDAFSNTAWLNNLDIDEIPKGVGQHCWNDWEVDDTWIKSCYKASGSLGSKYKNYSICYDSHRICKYCKIKGPETRNAEPHVYKMNVNTDEEVEIPACINCGYIADDYIDKGWPSWAEKISYDETEYYTRKKKYFSGTCIDAWAGVELSGSKFLVDNNEHKPTVVKAYLYYADYAADPTSYGLDEDDVYVSEKFLIPEKYYSVSYSGDGKKEGKYKVYIEFKDTYSGKLSRSYTVISNPMKKTSLKIHKNKTFVLKRYEAKKVKRKMKWWSSNNKIARVSSTGKITAKNFGKCKIFVKYLGKKYVCNVNVVRYKLDIGCYLKNYSTRNNIITVSLCNFGPAPIKIYASGSKLIDLDYKKYDRTFKNVNGKRCLIIKPCINKYRNLKFKVRGSTTWPGTYHKKIRLKVKCDGKTYTRYAYP